MYADVYLADATTDFDHAWTYAVPPALRETVRPGAVVYVPFGSRRTLSRAYVTSVTETRPTGLDADKVRAIAADPAPEVVLTPEQVRLAKEMRRRYFCTLGKAADTMVPPHIMATGERTVTACRLADPAEAHQMIEDGSLRYLNHVRILELLLEYGPLPLAAVRRSVGVSQSVLRTMKKNGLIEFFRMEQERPLPQDALDPVREAPKIPNEAQRSAIAAITAAADAATPGALSEYLLHGVTGSGKTEVYLQAASHVLEAGRDILILVPEIALTPQMTRRLTSRFGADIAIFHSRMTPAARYETWRRIRAGEVRIVVGARSAVFAPLSRLGLIVVDEEQEATYKAETVPRYHATEIARMRAMLQGAVLVLGSATPSVTAFNRTRDGRSVCLTLPTRIAAHGVAPVQIVDMRRDTVRGTGGLLSGVLAEALEATLARGRQAMLLLNRRGFSRSVICHRCGWQMRCPHCDVALTRHRLSRLAPRMAMVCHYCERLTTPPEVCPECGSDQVGGLGFGTQQAEEILNERLPEARILRMDQDTTRARFSHAELLDAFAAGEADILLGTQMIAKGHDFPNVTLSAVLSADQLLGNGEFRDAEQAFQLMAQMAGRAGRGEAAGRVYFQTFQPEHFVIRAAAEQNYERFFKEEIAFRERMGFPPFGHIGLIMVRGTSREDVARGAQQLQLKLRELVRRYGGSFADTQVSGAAPAPLERLRDRYRYRLIARDPSVYALTRLIETALAEVTLPDRVTALPDIDPWMMA